MARYPTRATVAALFLLAAILWCSKAEAITYTYAGTCTADCERVGLSAGASVSGSITFLDAALVPGSPYPAPIALSLDFGTVEITGATADIVSVFAFPPPPFPLPPPLAIVPTDLSSFPVVLVVAENPVPPDMSGDWVTIDPGVWRAHPDANCVFDDCRFAEMRGLPASGTGAWSVVGAVPEPSTLSLLTTVVLGAGWLRRRIARSA